MKKNLFWGALMCLVTTVSMTACGSDDDNSNSGGMEKTYADDDFVMTDRNIKEKLVGDWGITYLKRYEDDLGWVEYTEANIGSLKNAVFRGDGSGEIFGLEDVHWAVADGIVTISSLYLICTSPDAGGTLSIPLGSGNEYGVKRSDAEATVNSIRPNATFSTELRETLKFKVRKMEKDFFNLYQVGERWNAEITLKRW